MGGGAWWAAVHGVTKSQIRLSDFTFPFHFHALEKEMATHSSVLAWRIPGTGEPGGLPSMGSHRVGHDWSDLAAVAAAYTCQYNPSSLLLDIYMREMTAHVHTVTYMWMFTNSFIQNHPKTEDSPNIYPLTNSWTNWSTFILWRLLKKEWTTGPCNNMDKSQMC